jgi:hypothetical protein
MTGYWVKRLYGSAGMSRIIGVAAGLAALFCAYQPAHALTGIKSDGSLDKPTLSKAYFEGEFWTVERALETFRISGYPMNRDDSVYVFKYLSVIYASDPSKRTKAESYMVQLIRMMPTIDLLDLYISDNIQSIFAQVKTAYQRLQQERLASLSGPAAAPSAPSQPASGAPGAPAAAPAKPAPPAATAQAPAPGASATSAHPAAAAEAHADGATAPGAPQRKAALSRALKIWVPVAAGTVGLATAAYFVFASSEGSDASKSPRPVDVSVDWPKEGSP